jgi:hypothetical protein
MTGPYVVKDRKVPKQGSDLKSPDDSFLSNLMWSPILEDLTLKFDRSRRSDETCDRIEGGGLTGPVWPDQAYNLISEDGEIDRIDGRQPSESHRQLADLENLIHGILFLIFQSCER